jgi:hypothetical protein
MSVDDEVMSNESNASFDVLLLPSGGLDTAFFRDPSGFKYL